MNRTHRLQLVLCTLLCFVLCSCQTVLPANEKAQVEELLRAPKLSGDYGALQTALNDWLGESAQLKYPIQGELLSPFVLQDLDGDGQQDAAVLYTTAQTANVCVAILQRDDAGSWQVRQSVEGLGFAIPINDVQSIISDIMENGSVTDKAYMAITAGTMTQQMAAQYKINATEGVFVYSVEKGGAGDKAGLKLGDVITKLNDTAITSMEDLSAAKKNYKAGDTVTLTVYRDGQEITTQLTFDTQPQTTGSTDSDSQQTTPDSNSGSSGGSGGYNSDLYDYFFGRH